MFIVIEVQANVNNTAATLVSTYSDVEKASAESQYHTILSSAAISNIYNHSAFMLTDDGRLLRSECYHHEVPIEPEVEE